MHPKKEEVRFLKPIAIKNALTTLVKESLQQNLNKQLAGVSSQPQEHAQPELEKFPVHTNFQDSKNNVEHSFSQPFPKKSFEHDVFPKSQFSNPVPEITQVIAFGTMKSQAKQDAASQEKTVQPASVGKIIGQLFNTYILIEREDAFILIDQHAAHERIIYEKILKNFQQKDGVMLMFPHVIKLPEDMLQLVLREKDFFAKQGIELDIFGNQELVVKTSPPKIRDQDLTDIILQAAQFIQEHEHLEQDIFRKKLNEHVHSHLACKSAIKAGDVLTHEQMLQLIKDLQDVPNRFICVHGRPTTWSIPKNDVEKKFRRK